MGIINCTPDSFYEGSRRDSREVALQLAQRMVTEGVDFIDVGGESSRPGSEPVSQQEELRRVLPVIELLSKRLSVPISIDTTKAEVARRAIQAGASMVNDISAMRFDPEMVEVVATYDVPVILMHIKGQPKEMQTHPRYDNLLEEIETYLARQIELAVAGGVSRENIIVDPGIGFGKRLHDNYELIRNLRRFAKLNRPVLVGLSRKSFIQKILDLPAEESLEGTIVMNTIAILNGAHILRVHDVKAAKRAAIIADYYSKTLT